MDLFSNSLSRASVIVTAALKKRKDEFHATGQKIFVAVSIKVLCPIESGITMWPESDPLKGSKGDCFYGQGNMETGLEIRHGVVTISKDKKNLIVTDGKIIVYDVDDHEGTGIVIEGRVLYIKLLRESIDFDSEPSQQV